jgi:hypothetical protein
MNEDDHDQNYFVVYAVEYYANKHGISPKETMDMFIKRGVNILIRDTSALWCAYTPEEFFEAIEDFVKRGVK